MRDSAALQSAGEVRRTVATLDDPLRGPGPEPPAAPTPDPAPPTPRTRRPPQPAAPRRQAQPQAEDETPTPTEVSPGDPNAGSPKIAVNMRATKQLWDQLGAL